MSRFEDAVATRKRTERKKRQMFLQEQISRYKMGSFTIGEVYCLFTFFALADPSEEELLEATRIIKDHISDVAALLEKLGELIPPKK